MRYQPEPRQSILDRLIDREQEGSAGSACSSRSSINSLIDSVLRDLENLFNTRSFPTHRGLSHRRLAPHGPVSLPSHLECSILTYGSRDFSLHNPRSHQIQQSVRLEIVRLLESFEPRLTDVTVRLGEVQGERSLSFRIDAVLQVEPVAVPTAFDTHFDLNSGSYTIFS